MTALISLACLVLGVLLSGLAPRAAHRMAAFETCGGLLLVAGFAALGAGLPLFR
ncbi:hypothetical protein [Methylobacterium planeticum]|uniref:hypothetical protein n=1 Tax=Methylobacterium planeticum TaxID=2615211 RepID=UPI00177F1395|nr:hypothetical protein [Methylobacterium planeticum]